MKKKQFSIILIHILAWGILVSANVYVFFIAFHKHSFYIKLIGLALSIILFYLNYSLLIKKLFFKGKRFKFIVSSAFSFFIICSIAILSIRQIIIADTLDKQKHLTEKYKDNKDVNIKHIPPFHPDYNFHKILQESIDTFYLLFSVYGISIIIPFVMRWYDTEKRLVKQEKEKIQAELLYLKGQINPHFLFNSLNNIYALASRKSDNTTDAILKLSSILRYILYEASTPLVPLSKEIEHIRNFIEIQKLRLTNNIKIEFNTSIDDETKEIEPLLLIPLVENAFKYGVDSTVDSIIVFNLAQNGDALEFVTKNHIANLSEGALKEDSGIGLKNVSRRLEITYSKNASIDYYAKDNIFIVEMKIYLDKHEMYRS